MSSRQSGVFKSPKSAMIFIGVFLALCIIGVIATELSIKDYAYGEPYEMQGVVSEKDSDRKITDMDKNGIAKNRDESAYYDYYIYVTLENGEEARIRCTLKSEYDKYKVGQEVTIVCRDMTDKGEFIGVAYSFKE